MANWKLKLPPTYHDLWDTYMDGGAPPVFPPVRAGVAGAVHNRKLKADKAAEKKGTGRRIKIRRERV